FPRKPRLRPCCGPLSAATRPRPRSACTLTWAAEGRPDTSDPDHKPQRRTSMDKRMFHALTEAAAEQRRAWLAGEAGPTVRVDVGLSQTGQGQPLFTITLGNFQENVCTRFEARQTARRLAALKGGKVVWRC